MFGVALYSTNTHVCTMLTGFLDSKALLVLLGLEIYL
jgi:hypothetical protein